MVRTEIKRLSVEKDAFKSYDDIESPANINPGWYGFKLFVIRSIKSNVSLSSISDLILNTIRV